MSTRRARIKAVASLPVRRKNIESQIKEEKLIRSPKTPRAAQNEVLAKSPSVKTASPVGPPQEAKTFHTPKAVDLLSPQNVPFTVITPKHSEKVPVITPVPRTPVSNTFASPLQWNSPARRALSSPVRNSPKSPFVTEAFVENLQSPNRCKSIPDGIEKPKGEVSGVYEVQRTVEQRVEKREEYNPPSIPESITDETGMDGIVPLHPNRNIPKPLDFLKSEIISENAPVLFDPIVPLPSPSKARPKLRPAPRLAPHRRNSVQGSASESEDESRRALLGGAATPAPARQRHDSHTSHSTLHSLPNKEVTRIRNDSVCSGVSLVAAPPPASPLKERHVTKCRRQEMSRRLAAMRRRRIPSKKDALTMYDLIFYNPTTNPIVPDQDELKAKEATLKEEEERKKAAAEEAEEPDEPPAAAPVPQIKLGPNGEIMLDEQSLVIQQTGGARRLSARVAREGAWGGGGGRYSRAPRTADWGAAETVRFYRALAAVGTDFTLMAPLFPDRTRKDLKLKFKKEERLNGAQVDKALRSQTTWDALTLQDEFAAERQAAERRARAEREQLAAARAAQRARLAAAAHARLRQSRGAKALETETDPETLHAPGARGPVTADDFIQQALDAKPRRKRKPPAPKTQPPAPNSQPPAPKPSDQYATLTVIKNPVPTTKPPPLINVNPNKPEKPNLQVPPNIEAGSLVVLTVNDPKSPTKKMLQTYISRGAGQLTPVALPPTLLNSVMGYMKKGTPKSNVSNSSSPQLMSPSSVTSVESRTSVVSATPSVIQLNPSPNKRQRHSSYSITQL